MPHTRFIFKTILATSMLCAATASMAQATFFGPTAYRSAADIPVGFYGSGGPLLLENFENGSLHASLQGSGGSIINNSFQGFRDSVDSDDGVIDGTCGSQTAGRCASWFNEAGNSGATFSYVAAGALPTAFGLVWTDGFGSITFSALGASGQSLGSFSFTGIPDGVVNATTAEDRFFGMQFAEGIRSISISNTSGGIEVDHVQYGQMGQVVTAVPEPETYAMFLAGLGLMGTIARRRRNQASS
ncbi:MAG: PEP-CTERM sorting domain-containing protein [Rhodoferax sp.]|jgi:hypothetical protein